MRARPTRHTDWLALRQLEATPGAAIVCPSQFDEVPPLLPALLMPGRERAWVAKDGRGTVAFVQAQPRKVVLGWEIVRLYVHPAFDPNEAVTAMMPQVLERLQSCGIPRLFARVEVDSPAQTVLAAGGFTHYMSERVLWREVGAVPPPEAMPAGLRYRIASDAWPLHQLESGQMPSLIRQLEGLTSMAWDVQPTWKARRGNAGETASQLVVERDGVMVGWIGWSRARRTSTGRESVRLGLLVAGDDNDLAFSLVHYALHRISQMHPRAIAIVRVREYQLGLQHAMADWQFEEAAHEALYIMHGRLQLAPKKLSRFFEMAPHVRAFAHHPTPVPGRR